ncbi:hypothetical protein BaRGS_00014733 [Batillaria attramentaria]|uniref:Uncharacterized protein n=1 Tax=Batillaria attramentaria TaxID=370345 RepID=A0ABD0L3M3_9CAEN
MTSTFCADVSQPSVVRWKSVCRKIPWGIFLLLGGGFALVEGIKVSGLSSLIAGHMMVFTQLPPWLAMISVIVSTSLFTEIVSNTVLTTLLLPILAQLAIAMDVHPIYLMLPATVASSFAFMLPVATPPNAIVFAYGDVKVVDMLKVGMRLNFVGMSMLGLVTNTIATAYFDLSTVPDWARQLGPNTTTVTAAFNQSMANSTVG